jgi:hypothetical protein
MVDEYIERKRLQALGIFDAMRDLPAWKADYMLAIDFQLDALRAADRKRDEAVAKLKRRT